MFCGECSRPYIIVNGHGYSCSGWHELKKCDNDAYINRSAAEHALLGPIHTELLSPDRVERMTQEMQAHYQERVHRGDPDMTTDEIQAAIERAEQKRREREAQQPDAEASAKVLSILPRAAQLIRTQIPEGLSGDPLAAGKARLLLREMYGRINSAATARCCLQNTPSSPRRSGKPLV